MNFRSIPVGALAGTAVLLVWALSFSAPAAAAYLSGISGTWAATQNTRFSINGFGSRNVQGDGNCTVTVRDSFHAAVFCKGFNENLGQTYAGSMSTVVRRKTLSWSLDAAGLEQVKANMTRLLIARNQQRGRVLEPGNVAYEFQNVNYQPVRVPQNFSQSLRLRAVFKGRATQLINGSYIVKPFTYKIDIRFITPAP